MDVNFVNNYFENVIKEMQPFIDENNFKFISEGVYSDNSKKFAVGFDDNRQMFTLSVADIGEEETELREINAWLFDETQNAKDAESVGIDFVNSLRKELGIKRTRSAQSNVELPSASKSGSMTVTGFTKKMLDVFPVLKDEYKNHVAIYGNFLYINFFGEHLVPLMKNLFLTGTKKQIGKFYDVFENAYVKGDRDTVNIMVALLTAAAYEDQNADAKIKEMLSENGHFLTSYNSFLPVFAKNKKLKEALLK